MGLLSRLFGRDKAKAVFAPPPAPVHGQPRFAVLDVETTGLSPRDNRILEIAVVTTDPWGRVLDEWTTRINPEGPVGATHIHGIRATDVARAPRFREILGPLQQRLAGAALAAHNATFDVAFLRAEYARLGWHMPDAPTLCTLEASSVHLPRLDRRRLADCCAATGVQLNGAHSALGDARATAALLAAFMHPHVGRPPSEHDLAMPHRALHVQWPNGPSSTPVVIAPHARSRNRRSHAAAPRPIARDVTPPGRTRLLDRFSLTDALDEGAPEGSLPYLEKVAEALEDGQLSFDEAGALRNFAESAGWTPQEVGDVHRAFIQALAHEALEDGRISRAERTELTDVSELLSVSTSMVRTVLDHAERARHARLSVGLGPLPQGWRHGEPLRVGDKVVFTGCESHERSGLERRAEELGIRVLGGVSSKVAMLVSDGTVDGTKLAKAQELGTRIVHPSDFGILLTHLQPARSAKPAPPPQTPVTTPTRPPTAATGPEPASGSVPLEVDPSVVREWARAEGWRVAERGRLSSKITAAYLEAHRPPDVTA